MSTPFVIFLRKLIFWLGENLCSLAAGDFRYIGVSVCSETEQPLVAYQISKTKYEISYQEFLGLGFHKSMTTKQLASLLQTIINCEKHSKPIEVIPNNTLDGLFIVKNKETGEIQDQLLSNIMSSDELLEKMKAGSIRCLLKHSIKLELSMANSENSSVGLQFSKEHDNIVHLSSKNDE